MSKSARSAPEPNGFLAENNNPATGAASCSLSDLANEAMAWVARLLRDPLIESDNEFGNHINKQEGEAGGDNENKPHTIEAQRENDDDDDSIEPIPLYQPIDLNEMSDAARLVAKCFEMDVGSCVIDGGFDFNPSMDMYVGGQHLIPNNTALKPALATSGRAKISSPNAASLSAAARPPPPAPHVANYSFVAAQAQGPKFLGKNLHLNNPDAIPVLPSAGNLEEQQDPVYMNSELFRGTKLFAELAEVYLHFLKGDLDQWLPQNASSFVVLNADTFNELLLMHNDNINGGTQPNLVRLGRKNVDGLVRFANPYARLVGKPAGFSFYMTPRDPNPYSKKHWIQLKRYRNKPGDMLWFELPFWSITHDAKMLARKLEPMFRKLGESNKRPHVATLAGEPNKKPKSNA